MKCKQCKQPVVTMQGGRWRCRTPGCTQADRAEVLRDLVRKSGRMPKAGDGAV